MKGRSKLSSLCTDSILQELLLGTILICAIHERLGSRRYISVNFNIILISDIHRGH